MVVNQKIALDILQSWGYVNLKVGDLDGRNCEGRHTRDRHYKTQQAVKHAFRLADMAISRIAKEKK